MELIPSAVDSQDLTHNLGLGSHAAQDVLLSGQQNLK